MTPRQGLFARSQPHVEHHADGGSRWGCRRLVVGVSESQSVRPFLHAGAIWEAVLPKVGERRLAADSLGMI